MTKKDKVITVYLDNYDKIDTEFSWLYKTWLLHSLDEEFDLMVFYDPNAESRLDKYPGIIPIKMPAIGIATEYPFLKSSYIFNEPWCQHIYPYAYVLKTDCDVFLTQHIKGYTPFQFLIGKGGFYNNTDEKQVLAMKNIADRLGVRYQFFTNVGASMFGEGRSIIHFYQHVNEYTEKIINEKLYEPYFDRGISSMIAGEIATNYYMTNQHAILYALDYFCWETTQIKSDTMHIHAWHCTQPWSKHRFLKGDYKDWQIESYEHSQKNAAYYCHWIATTPLEEILNQRKKLRKESEPIKKENEDKSISEITPTQEPINSEKDVQDIQIKVTVSVNGKSYTF